ncbi:MAG: heme exporter protein CcmD [Burkholderiales bacterium]|nr:heme exporter protein CcmD [Rhodocyclaceae bacterium]
MDGRGFYVWGSFGAFLAAIVIEIVLVRLRIHRAQQAVRNSLGQAGSSATEKVPR